MLALTVTCIHVMWLVRGWCGAASPSGPYIPDCLIILCEICGADVAALMWRCVLPIEPRDINLAFETTLLSCTNNRNKSSPKQ